jgi:dTDP-4-amino-4,6-dideoxygalactose transaminase
MSASSFTRVPPGGSAIPLRSCLALLRSGDPATSLRAGLGCLLGGAGITLHASGREALRVALTFLAMQSARRELVVPAYACYSIPAAAVAAGLRVRLVDVTPEGQLDPEQLARTPLDAAAAVLVCNLFGLAEAIGPLREVVRSAGAALLDDAAQALGARSEDGPVGARGDVGVLSFGRGKPLSALGGGAVVWPRGIPGSLVDQGHAPPRRVRALLRAFAYDVARQPWIFRALAAIPILRIGETLYDPDFTHGPLDGASLCLAANLLPRLVEENRAREERALGLAAQIRARSAFRPLVAKGADRGVHPRLAVLAPSRGARDAALAALSGLGAARFYPAPLTDVPALRPHLVGDAACPGARDFAARVLTLPSHAGLDARRAERVSEVLAGLR